MMSIKDNNSLESGHGSISKIPRLVRDPPPGNVDGKKAKVSEGEFSQTSNGNIQLFGKPELPHSEKEDPQLDAPHSEKRAALNSHIDDSIVYTQEAFSVPDGSTTTISYRNLKIVGTGSFGVVYAVDLQGEGEVAIKKVLQDERFKNRELQILRRLRHQNVITLHYYFYSSSSKAGETYLNLVQEYLPQTLSRLIKHYCRIRQAIPHVYVKLYSFQLLRGLAYIHQNAVCHRDIKPQNLIIDPASGVLKIIDFGSAKVLNANEPNVSYICSRHYRAPELIFGATHYTVQIDMWSAGCVIGELLLCRPLFPGGSGVDQMVEIIKVLGTPTPDQILEMNPQYSNFNLHAVTGCPWNRVIRHPTHESAFSVLNGLLVYSPSLRQKAASILGDPFFADLIFPPPGHPANATGHLPNGRSAPQFPTGFTESELSYLPDELVARIRECQRAASSESRCPVAGTTCSRTSQASEQPPAQSSSTGQCKSSLNVRTAKQQQTSSSGLLRSSSSTTGAGRSTRPPTVGSTGSREPRSDRSVTSSLPLHSVHSSSSMSTVGGARGVALLPPATVTMLTRGSQRQPGNVSQGSRTSRLPDQYFQPTRDHPRRREPTGTRVLLPPPPSMATSVFRSAEVGSSLGGPTDGPQASAGHPKPPPPTTANSESVSSATADQVTRSSLRIVRPQNDLLSQSLQHSMPLAEAGAQPASTVPHDAASNPAILGWRRSASQKLARSSCSELFTSTFELQHSAAAAPDDQKPRNSIP